jgi:DNA-binding PadR family transcriptional regulator
MRRRFILAGVLAILLVILLSGIILLLFTQVPETQKENAQPLFQVIQSGIAGNYGYIIFNYRGTGNITMVSYDSHPSMNIYVINDSQAIEATRLPDFIKQLATLEKYGYTVSISNSTQLVDGIYVLPSGAMPSYVLFDLYQNNSNATVIYLGDPDLLLSSGMKQHDWYSSLTPFQRKHILVYNTTLDNFMQQSNDTILNDILFFSAIRQHNSSFNVSGSGLRTATLNLSNATRLRLVVNFNGLSEVYDSPPLQSLPPPANRMVLTPNPAAIFPWSKSTLQFSLGRTNGTAFLSISKDGKEVEHDILRRVTDENVFLQTLQFSDPGDYVLNVTDNSGTIASGILHVNDLKVSLQQRIGTTYVFSVTLDGMPATDSEATVWLGNSSTKGKFYISDGLLSVNAQLGPGTNVFNLDMFGNVLQVPVQNSASSPFDVYIKFGIPGLGVMLLVYFGARITRKPMYTLRVGDSTTYIREEVQLPLAEALNTFKSAREDLHLTSEPITPHEFGVELKRRITNGADVTEGNVESILKSLVKSGKLESHREYYQLRGEGDVRLNTLRRMVKEKLIEDGVEFKEEGHKFVTKDYEIGFPGDKFTKKAIIVVDSDSELKNVLERLNDSETALLRIKQANGLLVFVPIDRLGGAL